MKITKQKLYCYVDETGQDTEGNLFVVSLVIAGDERDELLKLSENIEKKSGKGKFKWGKARQEYRLEYLKLTFSNNLFKGKLRYSVFRNTKDYDLATIVGIAKAVRYHEPNDYTASVYIDGLSKTKRREYGAQLRKLGIPNRNVQGVAKDENNSLTRLADSVAGFVRDVLEGNERQLKKLFDQATKSKSLVEV